LVGVSGVDVGVGSAVAGPGLVGPVDGIDDGPGDGAVFGPDADGHAAPAGTEMPFGHVFV
jgi:hypothetical protein